MEENNTVIATPVWDSHIRALHSRFQDEPCIAWINPAQGDPFETDELVGTRKVPVPVMHPRFDQRYAPYLVELDLSRFQDGTVLARTVELAANAWTLDSLQQMNGQPVCGWVAAPCSARELATYWARTCHVHYRNGQAKLLRFHDPGVREWLWPALDSQQRRVLLGPALHIMSVGRDGDLLHQSIDDHQPLRESASLTLTAKQWNEVEDYAVVHAAWLALCGQNEAWRSRLSTRPGWHQHVLNSLERATEYGITDSPDRALFARHALEIGTHFHLHAALAPVWEKTRVGEFYGGALEEVFGDSADRLSLHLHHEV
ncbi:DUF4123 domain-containing protein [Herbaspirillum sp. DW155]|uniref:DUF4123 domain-containing protein n=1 Tax=Herbaspirillum sp. DW155 TaxID=3095609 RepID=UPI00308BAF0F|nr:DUF4123 domain-containing protein [Herbaspirillum sp. DW155]